MKTSEIIDNLGRMKIYFDELKEKTDSAEEYTTYNIASNTALWAMHYINAVDTIRWLFTGEQQD